MGKIAALTRKINPARGQLNTVARPPCEEAAKAVAALTLERWRNLFEPPADIICPTETNEQPAGPDMATDTALLGLLGRRPCNVQDVSQGLGLHSTEAAKRLDALRLQGRVATRRQGGTLFYIVPTPTMVPYQ
jgi:hypothetical protein